MTDNDPKRSTEATTGNTGDSVAASADSVGPVAAEPSHSEFRARQQASQPDSDDATQSPDAQPASDDGRSQAFDAGRVAEPPLSVEPPPVAAAGSSTAVADRPARRGGRAALLLALLALIAAIALAAWTMSRFRSIESGLTHRLEAIDQRGTTIDTTQRQTQDLARDLQNRLSVLEGRVAQTAGLQAQVDKLYRDRADDSFEVTLVEVESGLALAAQQLSLGASPRVVLARLQDLEARLERENDARLAPLRSALLADIERLRVHPSTDVGSLALRINSVIAALDQLPLLSSVDEASADSSGVDMADAAQRKPQPAPQPAGEAQTAVPSTSSESPPSGTAAARQGSASSGEAASGGPGSAGPGSEASEGASTEGTSAEAASSGEVTSGGVSTEGAPNGGTGAAPTGAAATGNAATGESSNAEAPTEAAPSGEAPTGDRSEEGEAASGATSQAPDSAAAPGAPDATDASGSAASNGGTGADAAPASERGAFAERAMKSLRAFGEELRELFRVRRIDAPEAMLIAPDQAYFLRQNLRLTLLNARLALLMRNEEVYRSDLEQARRWIDRYFDTRHRNVQAVQAQLRQLLDIALELDPPRIDESLAAVRAARAGVR